MTIEKMRETIVARFRMASEKVKEVNRDDKYWDGYKNALMDLMADDVKHGLEGLKGGL